MSISSVTSNTAGTSYSKAATSSPSEQAASAGQAAAASSPSTIVTLSNGQQTQVVEASPSSLKATPLALAWAPHMLVAADSNKD